MNIELRNFIEQMLRTVLMTLMPVVATAFLTMPMSLGAHPGDRPAPVIGERHMT